MGDFTVINCIKLSNIFIEKEHQVSQFAEEAKRGTQAFQLRMQLKLKKSQSKGNKPGVPCCPGYIFKCLLSAQGFMLPSCLEAHWTQDS